MNNDWYDNKALFEMVDNLKSEITDLRLDMKETKTLIRDYNGLRSDVAKVAKRVQTVESKLNTTLSSKHEYIGYFLAILSLLFVFLNYVK